MDKVKAWVGDDDKKILEGYMGIVATGLKKGFPRGQIPPWLEKGIVAAIEFLENVSAEASPTKKARLDGQAAKIQRRLERFTSNPEDPAGEIERLEKKIKEKELLLEKLHIEKHIFNHHGFSDARRVRNLQADIEEAEKKCDALNQDLKEMKRLNMELRGCKAVIEETEKVGDIKTRLWQKYEALKAGRLDVEEVIP